MEYSFAICFRWPLLFVILFRFQGREEFGLVGIATFCSLPLSLLFVFLVENTTGFEIGRCRSR